MQAKGIELHPKYSPGGAWLRLRLRVESEVSSAAVRNPGMRRLWRRSWRLAHQSPPPSRANRPTDPSGWIMTRSHPFAGIGHQMGTWFAGYCLAKRQGFGLLPASIDDRWARHLNLQACYSPCQPPVRPRQIRLPPIRSERDAAGMALLDAIMACGESRPAVFRLAFNQYWWDWTPAEAEFRAAYWSRGLRAQAPPDDIQRLAMHIRRGDIREMRGTPLGDQRWVAGDWFVNVARQCVEDRGRSTRPIEVIECCSQEFDAGMDEDLRRIGLPVKWQVSEDPTEAFDALASAHIMIGSPSGFSHLAGMVNRGIALMPSQYWHRIPEDEHWMRVDPTGELKQGLAGRRRT